MTGKTIAPGAMTKDKDPDQPATVSATRKIQPMAGAISARPIQARPMGAKTAASTAPGMMTKPIRGTDTTLAISP